MSRVSRRRGLRRVPLLAVLGVVAGTALLPGSALARGVFVTGHDSDYHAYLGPSPDGAQHIIQTAIGFTTDGRAAPRILLVTDVRDPGGGPGDNSDPRNGLIASGFTTFDVADYGSGTAGVLDVRTVDFTAYDVVFVASDEGGWLRQVELDALNARRAQLTSYVNGGGGLIVMPESGLRPPGPGIDTGTSHDRLGFLPELIGSTVSNVPESGFSVTPFGASLGLTNADVNGAGNFAHTIMNSAGPYAVVDTDADGAIRTVAGKGPFCVGGSLTLTPPSQTVTVGTSATIDGTLVDACANPQSGARVTYTVVSGPDQGATGSATTDAGGRSSFSDRCASAGTDTIRATTTAQGGVTSNTVTVVCRAPITMTGRAFGLSARIAVLGLAVVNVAPTPDTGAISTALASSTTTPCVLKVTTLLISADTLCAKVTTALGPPGSAATATVQSLSLSSLAVLGGIAATAIESHATTTCAGSQGRTTFAALRLGTSNLVDYAPAPNTTLNLGLAKVVLNEQVAVPGGLTVNAMHVTVPALGTNVIVASSTSDIHNCP